MKQFYSEVIQYRGSHYDFGFWQGKQLRESPLLSNREKDWRRRKPRFSIDVKEVQAAYETYAPGLWEELVGLRDGLQMPLDQVLRNFGGYRVPAPRGGCSTVVTNSYLVRNYDYHPKTYEGRFVLFAPTDHGYATIGPSQRIVGRMDGMNEHGLSLAYNFMHRKKPGNGFICHAIGRIVLQNAKNIPEAVQILKDIPHRHSFSYVLVDRAGNKLTVEATPRNITTHDASLCTNHFHTLKEENRRVIDESIERMEALKRHWHDNQSLTETFALLNDPQKGVFVENYKSWAGTIHTTAYDPLKLEAWIALGGNQQPTKVNFANWLQGENLSIDKIKGEIHTDLNFAYME